MTGKVVHAHNPNAWEAEAGGLLLVQGQPGLHRVLGLPGLHWVSSGCGFTPEESC